MSKTSDLNLDMIDYAKKQLKKKVAKDLVIQSLIKKFSKDFKEMSKAESTKVAKQVVKDAIDDMKESTKISFMDYLKEVELKTEDVKMDREPIIKDIIKTIDSATPLDNKEDVEVVAIDLYDYVFLPLIKRIQRNSK
jgi:hydrogenase maturation factor HypE